METAASSKAASPEDCATPTDVTWPSRLSTILTFTVPRFLLVPAVREALVQLEIGADLLAPDGGQFLLVLADADDRRLGLVRLGHAVLERLSRGRLLGGLLDRGRGFNRGHFRVVFPGLVRMARRDDAIRFLGLVRPLHRQFRIPGRGLLLGNLLRGLSRIGIRSRRQLVVVDHGRGQFDRDCVGIRAQPAIAKIGPPIGKNERCAEEMKGQCSYRGENPQPSRSWMHGVEIDHRADVDDRRDVDFVGLAEIVVVAIRFRDRGPHRLFRHPRHARAVAAIEIARQQARRRP